MGVLFPLRKVDVNAIVPMLRVFSDVFFLKIMLCVTAPTDLKKKKKKKKNGSVRAALFLPCTWVYCAHSVDVRSVCEFRVVRAKTLRACIA